MQLHTVKEEKFTPERRFQTFTQFLQFTKVSRFRGDPLSMSNVWCFLCAHFTQYRMGVFVLLPSTQFSQAGIGVFRRDPAFD